jgi:hypothetical protein
MKGFKGLVVLEAMSRLFMLLKRWGQECIFSCFGQGLFFLDTLGFLKGAPSFVLNILSSLNGMYYV